MGPVATIPTSRRDPYAAIALLLALLIMVLPTEADCLFIPLREGDFFSAIIVALFCFFIVFLPFAVAWRRWKRKPEIWRSRGYLMVTLVILILNIVMLTFTFADALSPKTSP